MRKFVLLLSVAFAMLFAQQGRVLHDLGHAMHRPAGQEQGRGQAQDLDRCDLCLSFAHIAGVAPTPALPAAALRADLSYASPARPGVVVASAARLAARSRGPPISL